MLTLQASSSDGIPSAPVDVCLNAIVSKCPEKHGERIVGRPVADRFGGTAGWDSVESGRGDDVIDISQGGHDAVTCGGGHDRVIGAGPDDDVKPSCEVAKS